MNLGRFQELRRLIFFLRIAKRFSTLPSWGYLLYIEIMELVSDFQEPSYRRLKNLAISDVLRLERILTL